LSKLWVPSSVKGKKEAILASHPISQPWASMPMCQNHVI